MEIEKLEELIHWLQRVETNLVKGAYTVTEDSNAALFNIGCAAGILRFLIEDLREELKDIEKK